MALDPEEKKTLKKAMKTEMKLLKLMNEHLEKELLRVKKYRMKYGDLYARYKDTEEVKTDEDGVPKTVKLPDSWINKRKAVLDTVSAYSKALDEEESAGKGNPESGEVSSESTGTEGSILDKHREKFKKK